MKSRTTPVKNVVKIEDIPKYLKLIDDIFGTDKIISGFKDKNQIVKYYRLSHIGYTLIHSGKGAVHMALSDDGKFSKDNYATQPSFIDTIIKNGAKQRILELGCGNGYNSIWLAKRNPKVTFTGIDLTPIHLKMSKKHSKNLDNLQFIEGDFEDTHIKENSYDTLFAVESVCHAESVEKVPSETYRLLDKDGSLIIFDAFRKVNRTLFDKDLNTMASLVERSMAVKNFSSLDYFLETLHAVGFKEIQVEDMSNCAMPNFFHLQYYSFHFFKRVSRAKLLKSLLPVELVQNSIAGLFMPVTLEMGIFGYYRIIAKK